MTRNRSGGIHAIIAILALVAAGLAARSSGVMVGNFAAKDLPPPKGISQTTPSTLTVNRDGYQFEVKLNPGSNQVNVYTLGAPHELPRSMSFSMIHNDQTGETVDLNAVEPSYPGELPHYSGNISWFSNSYVAFELQFPIPGNTGEWKRIRAENRPTS